MSDGSTRVDLDQALEIVLGASVCLGEEQTGIINAQGRTLAETVRSEVDVPAWSVAAKDGYAALSEDVREADEKRPSKLSVLSESRSVAEKSITSGTVIRVRAGDALPRGADTVVAMSSTYRPSGGPEVLVLAESKPGANVQPAGGLIGKGAVVLEKGTVIGGAEMGLLASIGRHGVSVSRKPRVAIVTTGAGVVDVVDDVRAGEVRNSARYALVGMVLEAGCELGCLLHARGGRIGLERAIADCAGCDAIIIAMSPGESHDSAIRAVQSKGEIHFGSVYVEPGLASAFATVGTATIFVTPNDCALEIFEAIIRPGLLRLLGRTQTTRPRVPATLLSTVKLNPGYSHLIRATTIFEDGAYKATVLGGQGSTALAWMRPNSILTVPSNIERVGRGESVDAILLEPTRIPGTL